MGKTKNLGHLAHIVTYDVNDNISIPANLTVAGVINGYATQSWISSQSYLTSFTETDPIFTAHAAYNITSQKITNWDTAYGWGNHALAGYLVASSLTGYATQSYVGTQIANLVASAPSTLDTLNELATALGNDPNFATTMSTSLGNRLRIDIGTQSLTSTQQGYGRTNLGLGSLATLSAVGNGYITDVAWAKLTGVPSTFAPSAHTHIWTDITDRPTNLSAFTNGPGYITGISSAMVTAALGYTPYNSTNPSGYITGINSSMVTTALGFTPYNSSNPNGYITSGSSISGGSAYLTGGDSNFYAYLLGANSGDLNTYNSPGLYSSEYIGSTNRPVGQAGHWIQISDAGGTDVKSQWYYQSDGAGIYMRLQWGNGTWRGWRTLITDSNIASQSVSYATTAGSISGYNNPTTGVTANTIVYRDGNGHISGNYILGSYFNSSAGNSENPTIGQVWTQSTGDNYLRKSTPAHFISQLGLITTSNIGSQSVNQSNYSAMDYLMSIRNFGSGTLVQTSINYAATYGDPFVLEIKGNSYGSGIPWDIQVQGYIYADTIINIGGYSNGTNISGLRAINYGGNLCFWWPSQGYWHGFSVKVYVAYDGRQMNRVTSISDTGQPTSAKQVDFSPAQSLRTDNAPYAANMNQYVRTSDAPTFSTVYTSDWFRATGGTGMYWQSYDTRVYSDTSDYVKSRSNYGWHLKDRSDNSRGYLYWDGGGFGLLHGGGGWSVRGNVNSEGGMLYGSWTANGDMRSPVFYDSQDTTYFFDGNDQTRAYRMNLSSGQVQASNNAGGRLRVSSFTNGESEINGNCHNIHLGPYSTRTGAGYYYAGIAIGGLMNYSGSTAYDVAPHIWLGAYYRDTPGSERSDFIIAVKSGVGTSGTGSDVPQVRVRVDYSGNLTATGDVTAYSDARVKENIKTIDNSLDIILKLRGVRYNRIDLENKKTKIGVIAQETELVLPEVVDKDTTGMYNVSYGNMAGLFIEAIKGQQRQIEDLKKQIIYLVENK